MPADWTYEGKIEEVKSKNASLWTEQRMWIRALPSSDCDIGRKKRASRGRAAARAIGHARDISYHQSRISRPEPLAATESAYGPLPAL